MAQGDSLQWLAAALVSYPQARCNACTFYEPMERNLKKSELIEDLAAKAEVTKPQAKIMLERLIELMHGSLKKDGRFPLSGVGTFTVSKRAARVGRNPSTGESVKIKASKVVRFRAAPDLKATAQKAKL